MIARVSVIAAIVSVVATAASAQDANRPFDVSLSAAHVVDLSSVYQQGIREATDAYRGDFPNYSFYSVTSRTVVRHRFHFLASAMNVPPELQEDFDPFPQVPFTLSSKPGEMAQHP